MEKCSTDGADIYAEKMLQKLVYCSFQNVFAMVFANKKISYHAQNVEIWRRNVECHDLTFCVQRVMLRVTRRRKRAFV